MSFREYLNEGKNHMGETTYSDYYKWKAACKKVNTNVKFDGDKDICNAHGVGEWDGEVGTIYKQTNESKDIYVDLKSSQQEMLELEDELGDDFFDISWEGFVAVVKPQLKTKFLAAVKKLKLKHEILK